MFRRILDRKGGWLLLTAVAVGLFVAANLAVSGVSGARIDLTQDRLFTLSDGSKNILSKLEQPVTLTLYYSERLGNELPVYANYSARVRDMLNIVENAADGNVTVEVRDPVPFSETEDEAVERGLQGVPIDDAGEKVYFGLNATAGDRNGIIPFFQIDRENFLEYDLMNVIHRLGAGDRPVLAVYGSRPMFGDIRMIMQGLPARQWAIIEQLSQRFQVRQIFDLAEIWKEDPDVLMLVLPADLSDKEYYSLDQYFLRGGKALIFVDPLNEAAAAQSPGGFAEHTSADLRRLLDHWGIEVTTDRVVGDRRFARMVNAGDGQRIVPAPYMAWMTIREEGLAPDEAITSNISVITVQSAGALTKRPESPLSFEPLLTTSEESDFIALDKVKGPRPKIVEIWESFEPSGERLVVAARVSGRAKTMFPDGPPKDEEAEPAEGQSETDKDAQTDGVVTGEPAAESAPVPAGESGSDAGSPEVKADKAERNGDTVPAGETPAAGETDTPPATDTGETQATEAETEPVLPPFLAESTAPFNVVLVADTDMLEDRAWVQTREFFGRPIQLPFANNADFVVNAAENLAGGDDLISLRSRGTAQRPFTKFNELRLAAERQYRAEERALQKKLQEAEGQLAELQRQKQEGVSEAALDDAVQATARQVTEEILATRQELRRVQHALRQDIERLQDRLRFVNIALIPMLVGVAAGVVGVARIQRRRRGARS